MQYMCVFAKERFRVDGLFLIVNFGYQSLFLKTSLEKRGHLIIMVVLYSGQYGVYSYSIYLFISKYTSTGSASFESNKTTATRW